MEIDIKADDKYTELMKKVIKAVESLVIKEHGVEPEPKDIKTARYIPFNTNEIRNGIFYKDIYLITITDVKSFIKFIGGKAFIEYYVKKEVDPFMTGSTYDSVKKL